MYCLKHIFVREKKITFMLFTILLGGGPKSSFFFFLLDVTNLKLALEYLFI